MSGTRPIYKFQRGEPIVVGWEVLSGDPAGYSLAALLKPTRGQIVPAQDVAPAAEFAVEFEPASGSGPDAQKARWILTIDAEATALLDPGHYVFDARLSLDGEVVQVTEPAFVTLTPSVSG